MSSHLQHFVFFFFFFVEIIVIFLEPADLLHLNLYPSYFFYFNAVISIWNFFLALWSYYQLLSLYCQVLRALCSLISRNKLMDGHTYTIQATVMIIRW